MDNQLNTKKGILIANKEYSHKTELPHSMSLGITDLTVISLS